MAGKRTRRKARSLIWLLVLGIALAAALAALVALATPASAPATDGSGSPAPASSGGGKVSLKIGWSVEPDNLNPFIGYEDASYEVWSLNYDYLFNQYPDGTRGPELALERPTVDNGGISADGKTVTVKIRDGVKFSDGKPLTAADVAWTYDYIVDNQLWNFTMMTQGIKHVDAVDSTTVRFTLLAPKADLTSVIIPILPEHVWQNVDPRAVQTSYNAKLPLVGSGPFQVVEYKKGEYLKMARNPYYWGQQPTVDEIYYKKYLNTDTMTEELKLNTIDAAQGISKAQFAGLKSDSIQTASYNCLTFEYISFNCYTGQSKGNAALTDPAFRRALASAVDRTRIIQVAWAGLARPGTTIINPDTWKDPDYHWEPPADQALSFSIDKANQMLDAAGYKDVNGDGFREDKQGKTMQIRLWAPADRDSCQSEGKLIAGWWKQLHVNVQYEVLDSGAIDDHLWNYEGNTYVPDYDAYITDTTGFADPGQTVPWFTKAQIGNWNEPCWYDPEYDRLSVEQASIMDPQKRAEAIQKMQQIFYESAAYPVLTYPDALQAYNVARWDGWTPLGFGAANGSAGPVFMTAFNVQTYLDLKPKSASSSGGSNSGLIALIVAAAAVVAIVVWLVVRRRSSGGPALEED